MKRQIRASAKKRRMKIDVKFLFLVPAIALLLGILEFPGIFNLFASTQDWWIGKSPTLVFVKNYVKLINDVRFIGSLTFTLKFVLAALALEMGLGLFLALIANRIPRRARNVIIPLVSLPIAISGMTSGWAWRLILHADYGPLINFLMLLGFPRIDISSNPIAAFWALIISEVWQWTPFVLLVFLAALASLPKEPFEAAVIDGASSYQVFRHITLPLLYPIILTIAFLRMVELFKVFDIIFVITGGGPGTSTESLSLYIYTVGLEFYNIGYAGALAWVYFLIVLLISAVLVSRLRREMVY